MKIRKGLKLAKLTLQKPDTILSYRSFKFVCTMTNWGQKIASWG